MLTKHPNLTLLTSLFKVDITTEPPAYRDR